MHFKGCAVYISVLMAAIITGCIGPSDASLAGTSVQETQAPVASMTDSPVYNTPASSVAVDTPTSSPGPSPTKIPVFKLPEEDAPGWLFVFPPKAGGVARIAFAADGKTIASAFAQRIDFYDVQSGELVNTLSYQPPGVGITDLALTPDGSVLVTASRGRIDVWDIAAKTFQTMTRDPTYYQFGTYQNVELSPDGALLATGPIYYSDEFNTTADHAWRVTYAEVWETETWKRKWVLRDALPVFSFSPDGKSLATLSGGGLETLGEPTPAVIWDMIMGARREVAVAGILTNLAFATDGTTLAINTTKFMSGPSAGVFGTLLLDTRSGQVQRTFTNAKNPLDLNISPDGELAAVLYDNDQIVLWNIKTGEQFLALNAFDDLRQLAFSPDGRLLAAVSPDGRIMFWNVPSH